MGNLVSPSIQLPSALNKRIINLSEHVQWQRLPKFHPHECPAKNLTQKRIRYRGAEIFIGAATQKVIHLDAVALKDFEYVVSDPLEEAGIFLKIVSFRRETLTKTLHETIVTRGQRETLLPDDNLIDTIRVYLPPRQVHQPEIFKERTQGLAFTEASDIM